MTAPREYQNAAEACGWVPLPRPQPAHVPAVQHGDPRPGSRVILRDAPRLPDMPQMLPDDSTEAAWSAAALRAMMGTDYAHDDAQTKALGLAIRAATVGTVFAVGATLAWGALYIWRADVGIVWLPVAWLVAAVLTAAYTLASERAARHYSAAGVEHAKIAAAVQMHADRLEARREMHAQATEAWQEVLGKSLDRWGTP